MRPASAVVAARIALAALAATATLGGCGSCGGSSHAVVDVDGGATFIRDGDGGRRYRIRNRPDTLLNVDIDAGAPP